MRARPCRLRPGDTARTVVLRLCSSPSQSEMMLRICSSRHCRTYDHPGTPWSGRGWQERRAGAEQAQPPQRAHLTRLPRARRCCVYAARLVRARSSCIAAVAAPARHPPRGPVVRSWMGRAPSRRLPNAASPAGAPDAASARTAVLRLWSTPSQSQIILHSSSRRSRATPTPGTPWCCVYAAIAAPAQRPPRGRHGAADRPQSPLPHYAHPGDAVSVVNGKSAEPAPLKRSLPRRRPRRVVARRRVSRHPDRRLAGAAPRLPIRHVTPHRRRHNRAHATQTRTPTTRESSCTPPPRAQVRHRSGRRTPIRTRAPIG